MLLGGKLATPNSGDGHISIETGHDNPGFQKLGSGGIWKYAFSTALTSLENGLKPGRRCPDIYSKIAKRLPKYTETSRLTSSSTAEKL